MSKLNIKDIFKKIEELPETKKKLIMWIGVAVCSVIIIISCLLIPKFNLSHNDNQLKSSEFWRGIVSYFDDVSEVLEEDSQDIKQEVDNVIETLVPEEESLDSDELPASE